MILADALFAAMLLVGVCMGVASLVVAVLIETPVLWVWWRRKRLWLWVPFANVLSLLAGLFPATLLYVLPHPGEGIDPWEWYHTAWARVLVFTGIVWLVTVSVELLVYWWMNRTSAVRLSRGRLVLGTVAANVLSYVPMIAYLLYTGGHTGDFEFRPDTTWVAADDTRVYFVEQTSNRLHSIRLDGSDRRVELEDVLGRFESDTQATAVYALLEGDARVLFVGADRQWYVHDAEGSRRLDVALPRRGGRSFRADVTRSLRAALVEAGVVLPVSGDDSGLEGVYLSSSTRFEWDRGRGELKGGLISSGMTVYSGAGMGLRVPGEPSESMLSFGVAAGALALACNNPAVLPDDNTVVFRCGDSILVMDHARRRVGRLVRGDSLLLKLPEFSEIPIGAGNDR